MDSPDKGFFSPLVVQVEWTHLHLDSAAACVVIRAFDLEKCVVCVCLGGAGGVWGGLGCVWWEASNQMDLWEIKKLFIYLCLD